jgi:iron(III) transport system substrate-binding protein
MPLVWKTWSLAVAAVVLGACAPGPAAPAGGAARAPEGAAGSAPAAQPAGGTAGAPADWQAQWERTLAAARQEGSLILVIQTGDLYRNWALEFTKKYPDIRIEITGLPGRDAVPRVLNERRGGQYLWDVYVGGHQSGNSLKAGGALDPVRPALMLPDVLDDSKWVGGVDAVYSDVERQYMFGHRVEVAPLVQVNRDVVPEAELTRVEDLVDPKWKGRMSWQDPSVAGAGSADAAHILVVAGEDWLRRLLSQDIVITRDQRQQVDWLVRGRYPIGISASVEALQAYRREGLGQNVRPLAPESDMGRRFSLSMGIGLFNNAPHPNAAKVFLNWALTKEGQALWVQHLGNQASRRVDVLGPPEIAPDPNVRYRESVNLEENAQFIDRAQEIAQEYIK